jgi:hypothetical protein
MEWHGNLAMVSSKKMATITHISQISEGTFGASTARKITLKTKPH